MKRKDYIDSFGCAPGGFTLHIRHIGAQDSNNVYRCTLRNVAEGCSLTFKYQKGIGLQSLSDMVPDSKMLDNLIDMLEHYLCEIVENGLSSFQDFCRELGYDDDSISALKVYKTLARHKEQALRVLGPCLKYLFRDDSKFEVYYKDPDFFPDIKSNFTEGKHAAFILRAMLKTVTFIDLAEHKTVFDMGKWMAELQAWLDGDL